MFSIKSVWVIDPCRTRIPVACIIVAKLLCSFRAASKHATQRNILEHKARFQRYYQCNVVECVQVSMTSNFVSVDSF